MVGSPRSGTTLIVAILKTTGLFPANQVESFLLEDFHWRFGDLHSTQNRKRFIEFWITSKQFEKSGLREESFRELASKEGVSYVEVLRLFMDSIAASQGKSRWLEKTPAHVFHIEQLVSGFPNARIIHVIRDGRDVSVSRKQLGWVNTKSRDTLVQLVFAAKNWELSVLTGRRKGTLFPDNYIEVFYEKLIRNIDLELSRMSNFVGLNLIRDQLENNPGGALTKSNTAFGDQAPGVATTGIARWRTELTPVELRTLEYSIGDTLKACGYELSCDGDSADEIPLKYKLVAKYAAMSFKFLRFLRHKTIVYRMAYKLLKT